MTFRAAIWYIYSTVVLCIMFLIIGVGITQYKAVKTDTVYIATIDSLTARCEWYDREIIARFDSLEIQYNIWLDTKATPAQKERARKMSTGIKP